MNKCQLDAVTKAFNNNFQLISGPPGTGKTFVLTKIIKNFSKEANDDKNDDKILVCAPSNSATNNIAQHLINAGLKVIRFCSR